MKDFTALFQSIDDTTKTSEKTAVMADYFAQTIAAEGAWAVFFLTGRKLRQIVPTARLRSAVQDRTAYPDWLLVESYDAVGDLAETIALLLPPPLAESQSPLSTWVEERLLPLRSMSEQEQVEKLLQYCDQLTVPERLVFNKLITGSFRVGVSQQLVVKALSAASGVDEATIAHRLMGDWTPNAAFFEQLMHPETSDADISKPYPFYLAYPLEQELNSLGEISDWIAEWKWDGIRSQLIRRQGSSFIWSRGEELISESFPEILEASKMLPDGTVIDGEILAWKDSEVMPFQFLQKRISRKALNKKLLAEIPAVILAYDLLENGGQDLRREPLSRRRELLEALLVNGNGTLRIPSIQISPLVLRESWSSLQSERERSRELQVEGLMLKRAESVYGIGRRKGDWWKWKIDPYSIDAVLVAAQRGHGKRASLYTDYTFAVWQNGRLVPIAKAYSGLTDEEIQQVDAFVRKNTIEKFGPVRTVKPELVFEISFEGIQNSSRHKSGLAVRFPRIARWRSDKKPEEADTLQTVSALMHVPGSSIV